MLKHIENNNTSLGLTFSLTLYKSLLYLEHIYNIKSDNCMPNRNNSFLFVVHLIPICRIVLELPI